MVGIFDLACEVLPLSVFDQIQNLQNCSSTPGQKNLEGEGASNRQPAAASYVMVPQPYSFFLCFLT
jgi:hypothetical protein